MDIEYLKMSLSLPNFDFCCLINHQELSKWDFLRGGGGDRLQRVGEVIHSIFFRIVLVYHCRGDFFFMIFLIFLIVVHLNC